MIVVILNYKITILNYYLIFWSFMFVFNSYYLINSFLACFSLQMSTASSSNYVLLNLLCKTFKVDAVSDTSLSLP